METFVADLLGPLPDGNSVFVLVDFYSRYLEIAIAKNTSSEKVTSAMWETFVTHGLPDLVQTDTIKPYNTRSAAERTVPERFKDFIME